MSSKSNFGVSQHNRGQHEPIQHGRRRVGYLRNAFLAAMALGSVTFPAYADEPQEAVKVEPAQVTEETIAEVRFTQDDKRPKVWLGVVLKSIEGDLKTYLGKTDGVLIDHVSPDSPAAKAGIQVGDILIEVGKTSLAEPGDVMTALQDFEIVDEKPNALRFKLLRKGDERTLDVTPEARPEARPESASSLARIELHADMEGDTTGDGDAEGNTFTFSFSGDQPDEEVKALLEKLRSGKFSGDLNMLRLGSPSVFVMPEQPDSKVTGNFEVIIKKTVDGENLEVTVNKSDGAPATIVVKTGDELSEYSEKDIDTLPENVRVIVEPILNNQKNKVVTVTGPRLDALKATHSEKLAEALRGALRSAAGDVDPEAVKKTTEQIEVRARQVVEEARRSAETLRAQAMEIAKQATEAAGISATGNAELAELRKLVEELREEIQDLKKRQKPD